MTRLEKNWIKISMKRQSVSSIVFMLLGFVMLLGSFLAAINTTQTIYEHIHMLYFWVAILGFVLMCSGMFLSAKVAEGHKKLQIYKNDIISKRDGQYFLRVQTLCKEGKILESFKYFDLMKASVTQHMTLGYLLNELNNKYKDSPENTKIVELITKYLVS